MTRPLERADRGGELLLAHQDVVGVEGGDREDRDARAGEREGERREHSGGFEGKRPGDLEAPEALFAPAAAGRETIVFNLPRELRVA